MREAHRCLARWIWTGLEDGGNGPLHHQQPGKQPWICSMLITGQENRTWIPSRPLGEERFPEPLLLIWCSWRLPDRKQNIPLFCPLKSIRICLSICRTGQSPVEKAAWSRHFRKQCKACLVCRLTQHSVFPFFFFLTESTMTRETRQVSSYVTTLCLQSHVLH